MLGLILGGLGSAATAAGMSSLGAGLTAAGTAFGKVPGMGGMPGLPGVGPGAGDPGSMPFGFDITKMINPASQNLGTGGGQQQPSVPQSPLPAASPVQQAPVDVGQLLSIINNRRSLGS